MEDSVQSYYEEIKGTLNLQPHTHIPDTHSYQDPDIVAFSEDNTLSAVTEKELLA